MNKVEGQNPFFKTLVAGKFNPAEIVVEKTSPRLKEVGFRDYIIDQWERAGSPQQALRRTLTLYKPPVVIDSSLHLAVSESSFMEFVATRDPLARKFYGDAVNSVDPIGTSVLVVTKDAKLLVATKSENRGAMNVIGGYPDVPNDDTRSHLPADVDSNGRWDPFVTIMREVGEETGIRDDEFTDMQLTGIIFNNSKHSQQPIVTFLAQTSLDSSEIKKRENNNEVEIKFIPNTQTVIEELCAHPQSLIRTAMANLLLYGKIRFGEEWFSRMNQILTKEYHQHKALSKDVREQERRKAVDIFFAVSSRC